MKWSAIVGVLALLAACGGSETTETDGGARDGVVAAVSRVRRAAIPTHVRTTARVRRARKASAVCAARVSAARFSTGGRSNYGQVGDGKTHDSDDVLTPTAVAFH